MATKLVPDKKLLEIHENALEKDCTDHPRKVFLWGQELARIRKETKLAKHNLKLMSAQLNRDIRQNPIHFGLEKTTEAAIEATIIGEATYQAAQTDLIDAEYEEEVLEAFVEALRDYKDELRNMVLLHGQQYWSKPDTTVDSRAEAMKRTTNK